MIGGKLEIDNIYALQYLQMKTTYFSLESYNLPEEYENCLKELDILSNKLGYLLQDFYLLNLKTQKMLKLEEEDLRAYFRGFSFEEVQSDEDYEESQVAYSRYLDSQKMSFEQLDFQESILNIGISLKIYALLEDTLNNICEIYEKYNIIDCAYAEFEGKGIMKAVKYLESNSTFKIRNSNEWHLIRHWNKVRNSFMHNYGRIRKGDFKLEKAIGILGLGKTRKAYVNGFEEFIYIKSFNISQMLILLDVFLADCVLELEDLLEMRKKNL